MELTQFYGHFFIEHSEKRKSVRVIYKADNGVLVGLKKLKEYPELSDETTCFSANLELDKKVVGSAKNDGRGGCSMVNCDTLEDWKKFQSIGKHKEHLSVEDTLDWLVCLQLDFNDIIKKGGTIDLIIKDYPKNYLW